VPSVKWQSIEECASCENADAQCASWCQYKPQRVWRHIPQCVGCGRSGNNNNVRNLLVGSDTGTDAQSECLPWCRYKPEQVRRYIPECQVCNER